MLYPTLISKIEELRQKAQIERKSYKDALANIRSDTGLSATAKTERITELYESVDRSVTALSDKEDELTNTAVKDLERSLFGSPASSDAADIIAFRDANDRASRVTSESEAQGALEMAQLSSDKTMENAILLHALRNNWNSIINTFTEARPNAADQINSLINATQLQERSASIKGVVERAFHHSVDKPAEVGSRR